MLKFLLVSAVVCLIQSEITTPHETHKNNTTPAPKVMTSSKSMSLSAKTDCGEQDSCAEGNFGGCIALNYESMMHCDRISDESACLANVECTAFRPKGCVALDAVNKAHCEKKLDKLTCLADSKCKAKGTHHCRDSHFGIDSPIKNQCPPYQGYPTTCIQCKRYRGAVFAWTPLNGGRCLSKCPPNSKDPCFSGDEECETKAPDGEYCSLDKDCDSGKCRDTEHFGTKCGGSATISVLMTILLF